MKYTVRIAPETIFLTAVALIGAYLFIHFLSEVKFVIVVFLLAVIVAQAVEPFVKFFEKRVHFRRVFAVIISYLIVLLIVLAIVALIVPPLILEVQTIIVNLPAVFAQIQAILGEYYAVSQFGLPQQLQEAVTQLTTSLAQALPSLLLLPLQVGSTIVAGFTVFILSIYWLLISKDVKNGIVGLVPREQRETWNEIITEMSARVGGWVRGQILLTTSISVLTLIGLLILNMPFAIVLAAWAGLMEIVPMVGPIISAIPAVIVALFISPFQALLVIILYVIIQQIENHLVVPNLMGHEVGLQPFVVILAILTGAELMGIIGAFLAVPIAAALQVLIVRVYGLLRKPEETAR